MSVLEEKIASFLQSEQGQPRRVFHGRGQLYPGFAHLCVDWFNPVLLITAYDEIANIEALLASIKAADKLSQVRSIVLQRRFQQGAPAEIIAGDEIPVVIVNEGDLCFEVHLGAQQNAGLFLDTRLLREWLQLHSENKNVLNLFAYTCSLSVAAVAGGATRVTNVDISKTSIKWGEKNHLLNGQGQERFKSIPHNLFTSWGRIKQFGRYDLVIIDPPTRQRGSFELEKNYAAVLRKLPTLCNPGADVIATINSPFLEVEYLLELFAANVPGGSHVEALPAAPEFADKYPARGLKICHFKMDCSGD